jgi:steroid 5-alpha reductase family enzyme
METLLLSICSKYTMTNILLVSAACVILYVSLIWVISLMKKDMSIVDIGWGLGFVLLACVHLYRIESISPRLFLIAWLIGIWGFRLALHIGVRNHGKGEDPRYAAWRSDWGANTWWISYFKVFILQGVLMLIIASPLHVVLSSSNNTGSWTDSAGTLLWLTGFLIESIGDWQLFRFKKNPLNKGKIMDVGLWRYSRHPNYFGETLVWWGIFVVAIGAGNWYISLLGPLLITFLLLRVSGVTLLEKRYEGNDRYAEYKRKTSPFIPLPPKK